MTVSPTLMSTLNATQPVHLWAVGPMAAAMPTGTSVGDRFQVLAPHVWRDDQPHGSLLPDSTLLDWVKPYLKLYAHRLHVPEPYGVYSFSSDLKPGQGLAQSPSQHHSSHSTVLLLDNAPIDAYGQLLPSIEMAWSQASTVRQLHWLWQLGQLWEPLAAEGVATSLLYPENLRVRGWRVQLCELIADAHPSEGEAEDLPVASLHTLGGLWMTWAETAQLEIQSIIRAIAEALQAPDANWKAIAPQLNEALLAEAARQPLRIDIAGASTSGRERTHNEDAAFPLTLDGSDSGESSPMGFLHPRLAIVCDGIGGHAGGEVASQLVIRALKLQISALFADIFEGPQEDVTPPEVVAQQLEAAVRVVNNLIAIQNDDQGRQSRQRMGTTLTMAVQFPQRVQTPNGKANGHELYVVQVGDSRAYWLTPRECHCLTLDDDVKTREVLAGRSLPREAARRSDAIALTQALGTRQGEQLHIKVQRFLLEEDGVLLLCSDGLSDNNLVERYWQSITTKTLHGNMPLNDALTNWITLANQHNGQDNISVVMMRCRVSKDSLNLFDPLTPAAPIQQRVLGVSAPGREGLAADALQPQSTAKAEPQARLKKRSKKQETSAPKRPARPSPSSGASVAEAINPYADLASADSELTASEAVRSRHPSNSSPISTDTLEDWASHLMGGGLPEHRPSRPNQSPSKSRPSSAPTSENDFQDWNWMAIALGIIVVMFFAGTSSLIAWRFLAPTHFDRTLDKLIKTYEGVLEPLSIDSENSEAEPEMELGEPVFGPEESPEDSLEAAPSPPTE